MCHERRSSIDLNKGRYGALVLIGLINIHDVLGLKFHTS